MGENNPKSDQINNPFSFIPKLLFKREPGRESPSSGKEGTTSEDARKQTDVVRFSDPRPAVPPPLKLEAQEADKVTNKFILWQIPMGEAENMGIVAEKGEPTSEKQPRNLFSLFPRVELKIPLFNSKREDKKPEPSLKVEEQNLEDAPPTRVFLGLQRKVAPTLEVEAEEPSGRTSNPVVLWQVCALGGFLILQWAWGRWKGRKERGAAKDSSDDDHPEVDDGDSNYA